MEEIMGASLSKFVVEGFTPTFVKGVVPYYNGPGNRDFGQTKISPSKCIVVNKA